MKSEKPTNKNTSHILSGRELEILQYLMEGATSQDIAEKLYISRHTVDGHRRNMLRKCDCKNTIALISFCRKNSII
jgi:DNA-binding CsgD family transcriptional regulator